MSWTDYGFTKPQKISALDLHMTAPHVEEGSWDHTRTRATTSDPVTAHFGDLTDPLIDFIVGSQAVVGCVAWLTEPTILAALQKVECDVIVQKEDFLRPDLGAIHGRKDRLQEDYGRLSNSFDRHWFPAPLSEASYLGEPSIAPVRCMGNHNSERKPAMPRMHHKFLVRLEQSTHVTEDELVGPINTTRIWATAVWTGSFNFSKNGGRSCENAVEIHDPTIADAYLREFSRVATLSEPLDWKFDWVTPEYRIGS